MFGKKFYETDEILYLNVDPLFPLELSDISLGGQGTEAGRESFARDPRGHEKCVKHTEK